MYNILQDKTLFHFFKNYLESLLLTIILHFKENTVHTSQNICNQHNILIIFWLPHDPRTNTESLTVTYSLKLEQCQGLCLPVGINVYILTQKIT